MNFAPDLVIPIIFLIWLLILTFLFLRFYFYYSRIISKGKKESVVTILEDVLKQEEENKKFLDQLKEEYVKLEKEGLSHIQKIGLVRFNPFKDTGGDQSFVLALVDAEGTGVIISSLHTRTGTRWYAKGVVRGKGVEYDLSDDEQKALKGARILSENVK